LRIVLTGDPQRPLVKQNRNLEVFKLLMKHDVELLDYQEISQDEWKLSQSDGGKSFIADKVGGNDLVVGYEMPRAVIRDLAEREIKYINVIIHPARFMPDLVFGVKTNIGVGDGVLSKRELQAHAFEYKEWIKRNPREIPDLGSDHMVVGQSRFDRSVLYDGEFHKVEEYVTDFSGKVLRRHPDEHNLYKQEEHEKVSLYRYFDRLKTIEGINSSALYEAELFGVPNVIYHGPKWWEDYIPVSGGPLFGIRETPPNFFRSMFNVVWGYERRCLDG